MRDPEHAPRVAAKIVELAHKPITVGDTTAATGASVGVELDTVRSGGWKELVECVDAMAYEAKESGRWRFVVGKWGEGEEFGTHGRGSIAGKVGCALAFGNKLDQLILSENFKSSAASRSSA